MDAGPEALLRAYVGAFATLDPGAIVPFFQVPCLFVAPFGVTSATDADTLRHTITALVEHARTQGYRRTEIRDLAEQALGRSLCRLSGVFVRFDADDRELARFGFSYLLRNDGSGFRIVVAVAHEPPAAS